MTCIENRQSLALWPAPIMNRARLIALRSSQNRAPCWSAMSMASRKRASASSECRGALEHQLALDADQLRQIPQLLPVVAAGQDILDHVEAAVDLVGLAGTCGEFAEQGKKARQEARIAGAIELFAQQRQAGRDVAAP